MKKRILSMLLAIVMVATMLPTTAFAVSTLTHTHCVCGAAHAAVGDHASEAVQTWTAINTAADFEKNKDTGYYYLTDSIELSAAWSFSKNRDIVLCLNGHDIVFTGNSGSFLQVTSNMSFTLTDCQDQPGTITGCKSGAIVVNGKFTMYNGIISGNTGSMGAGVNVNADGAQFRMYGGKITGNTATSLAGGVYVKGQNTFEIAGAPVITGNDNTKTGNFYPTKMYQYTKNVYVSSNSNPIQIGATGLKAGAAIDVTPMFPATESEAPAAVVAIAENSTSDYSSYFTYTSGFEYIKQYDADKDEVQLKYVAPPVPQVEVKFDMQGHGEQVPSQTIDEGTCATKPADPTAAGYRFLGWEDDYGAWDFGWEIWFDTTFYAKWVEKTAVSITESVQTCLWDGTEKAFEIKGTDLTGFTVQYYVGDAWTTGAPSAVGGYDVKITRAEDNYYKAYEKVIEDGLVIEKLVASVTTAPEANTLTYTGQEQELVTAGAASGGALQYKLGESGAWSTEIPGATAAGGYTVYYKAVGDAAHDDSAEQSVNVTIGKAALTIKANHNSITYGDAPVANGVTYSGFVNGEDESVLAGTLGYTYGYTQGDNAGDYSITPGGLTGDNYEITFQAGTLTVEQKPITVTALDKRLRRNAKAPDWSAPVEGEDYTVQGLLPGQTVTVALSCAADMSARGEFEIAPVVNDPSGNYAVTTVNGVLTVYTVAASAADTTPVVSKTQGGAVAADKAKPAVGTEVTFKVTPNAGMQMDKVSVVYGGKEISVREKGGGVYAFFQPAGAVTITVTFKPVEDTHVCPADNYHDVQADVWYHEAVDWVLSNGIMTGYSDSQFGPEDVLDRAMVVQVLYNYEKSPTASIETLFDDVKAGQWYTEAVHWAADKGIVAGYGNGNFGPDDEVTIEQVAVILWNYSNTPGGYGDLKSVGNHSDWAANALRWAVDKGLLENVPFTNSNEKATRAQTAQMLMNYLKNER